MWVKVEHSCAGSDGTLKIAMAMKVVQRAGARLRNTEGLQKVIFSKRVNLSDRREIKIN